LRPVVTIPSVRPLVVAAAAACLLLVGGCGGSGTPGDAILFVSTRDGDYAVYGMNADGSDQGRLSDESGDTSTPAGTTFQIDPDVSPDGSRIAFASARSGSLDVYVMDIDGSDTRRLTTTRGNQSQPTWSPDGSRIAFQSDADGDHIYVMGSDGKGARRVTNDPAPEIEPAWSPDGRWIAYSRRLPGTEIRELWLVHPDGSARHRLTGRAQAAYGPAWSPDGRTIAFASKQETGRFEIYAIGADGRGLRRVTFSNDDAFEPAWSPDGKTLAFSRDGSIVTIDATGADPQVLTGSEMNDSSPDWNPRPTDGEEES
jgi:Tol biopolymer transport system component